MGVGLGPTSNKAAEVSVMRFWESVFSVEGLLDRARGIVFHMDTTPEAELSRLSLPTNSVVSESEFLKAPQRNGVSSSKR